MNSRSQLLIIVIFLITILVISCKSNQIDLFRFDPREYNETGVALSEIADEITYVKLDNSILLNRVFNIIINDDAIYLNSKDIGIIKYNREGKLIRKIGNIGNGPNEYLSYQIFCVDDNTGNIFVNDRVCKVFSNTGKFIRDIKFKKYGDYVVDLNYFNSNLFLKFGIQYENTEFEWLVCDTFGDLIKLQKRHFPPFKTNYGTNMVTSYKFENTLAYFNMWTDTVFSILPDFSEKATFIISPGDHRYPKSNLSVEQFTSGNYLSLIRILETSNYFIIQYFFHEPYIALIRKNNQEVSLIEVKINKAGEYTNMGFENDLDGGLKFYPINYFIQNKREYLIGLINALDIKMYVETDEFKNLIPKDPVLKEKFESLAIKLKETDNPVLVLVRLKE